MAKLYFVDGYHGGIRGHMPEGSWQDILHSLELYPDWKISLEIEPESWDYLRTHDFHTYRRMQSFIKDPNTADKIEFISGSYAQPFCWSVNGESNIRQLIHGIETVHRHFPDVVIDTYAVQEPCFTSSLPQILRQLGYRRMSLKNPTAWGGYMAKMPGAIVNLISGDGSSIPAVPRYECEELTGCSATEASGYDYRSISEFADKCSDKGIDAPIGMCLQDLGWSSMPLVRDIDVEYVTWREYFKQFGDKIKGDVHFSQEDIRVALPWGNRILSEMLYNVRQAENRILQTEKLLVLAQTERESSKEKLSRCHTMLDAAWKLLMQAQHHDGYICATCGEGTNQWGFRSNMLAKDCTFLLDQISDMAKEEITGDVDVSMESTPESEIWLRVYNTVGSPRTSQAEVTLGLDHGANSLHVYDTQGVEVPSQMTALRNYADGEIGTALLRFPAQNDGIGYNAYRVATSPDCLPAALGIARKSIQNTIEVKTDRLHLIFDLTKGGSLVKFLDYTTGRDYAAGVCSLGYLSGYSIREKKFIDTLDADVKCEFLENGPLCCRLQFSGTFHEIKFSNTVTIRQSDARVDFQTKVHFTTETDIGFPYEPKSDERYAGTRRSSCREDFKLGVQFPLGAHSVKVTKSAPFDIYDSSLNDTNFDSWTTIKHNIINGYADLYQESSNSGLAVFCDSINGYSLVDNLFSLTLAFGYHGNFWWGYQPSKGLYSISYSVMPHDGNWEDATVPFEDAKRREPLLVQRLPKRAFNEARTLLCSADPAVEVVTVLERENSYQVRLFNASSSEKIINLQNNLTDCKSKTADLWGIPTDKNQGIIGKLSIQTLI